MVLYFSGEFNKFFSFAGLSLWVLFLSLLAAVHLRVITGHVCGFVCYSEETSDWNQLRLQVMCSSPASSSGCCENTIMGTSLWPSCSEKHSASKIDFIRLTFDTRKQGVNWLINERLSFDEWKIKIWRIICFKWHFELKRRRCFKKEHISPKTGFMKTCVIHRVFVYCVFTPGCRSHSPVLSHLLSGHTYAITNFYILKVLATFSAFLFNLLWKVASSTMLV